MQSSSMRELVKTVAVPWWVQLVPFLPQEWRRQRYIAILKAREAAAVEAAWKPTGLPIAFVKRVSQVVATYCDWPNSFFVPNDEAVVLLFPNGDFNFESIDTWEALGNELSLNREELSAVFDRIGDHIVTYGQFVAELPRPPIE